MTRVIAVYDQGYRGHLVPKDAVELPSIDISKSDYHAYVKTATKSGILL